MGRTIISEDGCFEWVAAKVPDTEIYSMPLFLKLLDKNIQT